MPPRVVQRDQINHVRDRRRFVLDRQVKRIDGGSGSTGDADEIDIVLHHRERNPFIVGTGKTRTNRVAVGIKDSKVKIPVARQSRSTVGERIDLLEQQADINGPRLSCDELIPVRIWRGPSHNHTWVNDRIEVDNLAAA